MTCKTGLKTMNCCLNIVFDLAVDYLINSHVYHVGWERLEAACLWLASERAFQDPSSEHV